MEIFSEMVEFGIEIGKKAGAILMDYYKKAEEKLKTHCLNI